MTNIMQVLKILALLAIIFCCAVWIMAGAGRYQLVNMPDSPYVVRIDNLRGKIQTISVNGITVTRDLIER
jgi:hypothetical protein